jgi:hypothetical protein
MAHGREAEEGRQEGEANQEVTWDLAGLPGTNARNAVLVSGMETNWLPTPQDDFSLYIRAYSPKAESHRRSVDTPAHRAIEIVFRAPPF